VVNLTVGVVPAFVVFLVLFVVTVTTVSKATQ
jgi:hypothetical protein